MTQDKLSPKYSGRFIIFDVSGADTVEMKDINYANLKFAKLNNDLRMMAYNGTDSITFKDFFSSSAYWPETFIFKDQTIGFAQMMANGMNITGTSGNDLINIVGLGIKGDLTGNAGDDYLVGGFFNDTLDGGLGNDYLSGGEGDDRYVFEKGHGKDVVSDNAGTDTFVMQGIDYTNVIFKYVEGWENRNDLVMSGYNGSDSIVFKDVLLSKIHKNKIFEFKDKKIDLASILATDGVVILGTAADDTLFASNDTVASIRNVVNGYGGNDSLYGNSFKDTLNGGQGHDTLLGYGGDDVLNGEEDRDITINNYYNQDWSTIEW